MAAKAIAAQLSDAAHNKAAIVLRRPNLSKLNAVIITKGIWKELFSSAPRRLCASWSERPKKRAE